MASARTGRQRKKTSKAYGPPWTQALWSWQATRTLPYHGRRGLSPSTSWLARLGRERTNAACNAEQWECEPLPDGSIGQWIACTVAICILQSATAARACTSSNSGWWAPSHGAAGRHLLALAAGPSPPPCLSSEAGKCLLGLTAWRGCRSNAEALQIGREEPQAEMPSGEPSNCLVSGLDMTMTKHEYSASHW